MNIMKFYVVNKSIYKWVIIYNNVKKEKINRMENEWNFGSLNRVFIN